MKKALILIGALMFLSVTSFAYAAGHVTGGTLTQVTVNTNTTIDQNFAQNLGIQPVISVGSNHLTNHDDIKPAFAKQFSGSVTVDVSALPSLKAADSGIHAVKINFGDVDHLTNPKFYLRGADSSSSANTFVAKDEVLEVSYDRSMSASSGVWYAFLDDSGSPSKVPTATHQNLVLNIDKNKLSGFYTPGSVVVHPLLASASGGGGGGGCDAGLSPFAFLAIAGVAFVFKKGRFIR